MLIWFVKSAQTLAQKQSELLEDLMCVNFTAFAPTDPTQFYNMYNATLPLDSVLNDLGCGRNISYLPFQNNVFDCTALPVCNITCGGVNKLAIRYATWYGGCHIEWALHSHLLRGMTIVIIYIALNVSRYIFVWGISHLNWRSLTVGGFTFMGTATALGNTSAHKKLVGPISKAKPFPPIQSLIVFTH